MTGSPEETTPFACLVVFIIGVSVLGSILAGAHYFAVDLPKQQITAPENGYDYACHSGCTNTFSDCDRKCISIPDMWEKSMCHGLCYAAYFSCSGACAS